MAQGNFLVRSNGPDEGSRVFRLRNTELELLGFSGTEKPQNPRTRMNLTQLT